MPEDTRARIGDRKLWERVLYMLFCAIAYGIAEFVVALTAIVQVVCVLFTGGINERLHRLGRNVGSYIFELLQFATFNSERVPFPFSDWPDEEPSESPWQREATDSAPQRSDAASTPTPEPTAPGDASGSEAEPPAGEPPAPDEPSR